MLGEWYLPPGECQAIWTITEGTISISHLAILAARAGLPRTPYPEALSTKDAQLVPRPRSGGLRLAGTRVFWTVVAGRLVFRTP